jgi:PleD family two-component response regulator
VVAPKKSIQKGSDKRLDRFLQSLCFAPQVPQKHVPKNSGKTFAELLLSWHNSAERNMDVQKRILLVSRDPMALQTRKLMLGAYFEVSAACRVVEAKKFLDQHSFDLIVFCYTLTVDDCNAILKAARLNSRDARILTLTVTGLGSRLTMPSSCSLPSEKGPFILLKKSAELLGFEFKSKGRMVRCASPEALPNPRMHAA